MLSALEIFHTTAGQLECRNQLVKNGCFRPTPLIGSILVNYRDGSSGTVITWGEYQTSINRLACECGKKAKEQGHNTIGIQFFGECYGTSRKLHDIVTNLIPSTSCIGGDFRKCDNSNSSNACAGTGDSIYIYALQGGKAGDTGPINGNYSQWGPWSECSATCDGGVQERNRLCNNPLPANGGASCDSLGPAEMTQTCHNTSCPESALESKYCTKFREDAEFTYVEAGLHSSPMHPFCIIMAEEQGDPKRYRVSAEVYGYDSDLGRYSNNIGLIFNVKDLDNYQFVYIHMKSDFFCYTYGRVRNGEDDWAMKKSDQCPYKQFYGRQWIALELLVYGTRAEFRANSEKITTIPLLGPSTGRGGLLVKSGRNNEILFMYLRVDWPY